ncbi:nucleoside permease [Phocaeicola barnesiae]|uniref:nucleoside permease n=1 Tax=Phocaeicola barnesiae TaxID=376804 RepID=UPI0025A40522|nr:nucleoside permease [Phocaeicola barnesiae]MDM8234267.1 nucleoside permease [Phocaeicola barnesiae]MDM8252655.1 nucleoside permease [Phocaeicola barnesiae]
MNIKIRLTVMNFLQFAVWGAYLTSMGTYLAGVGLGSHIGIFYAMQGIVSLFMPAILGIIADRWVPAQRLLGMSHLLAALFMGGAGYYAMEAGSEVAFGPLFLLYSLSVAFYMPTLGLSNSVAFTALEQAGLDTIKAFPPIRTFGTIGFICSMWLVDLLGFQANYMQFFTCAVWGLLLALYANTLPGCPVSKGGARKSLVEALGLNAFLLFKQRKMAIFFIFSMLLGVSLQITNGFANPFITSFQAIPEYADTFGVQHANLLISLSQVSETCCILLIPFFLSRFGIKRVMLIAMVAWVLRFGLFGLGNPGSGVWMFILSMLVYGVAFDFFNVSGSLFVDRETDISIRSSAQGLFIIMTNGIGATVGTLSAQAVVNRFVDFSSTEPQVAGWSQAWFIFAAYALVVAVVFAIVFRYKHVPETK